MFENSDTSVSYAKVQVDNQRWNDLRAKVLPFNDGRLEPDHSENPKLTQECSESGRWQQTAKMHRDSLEGTRTLLGEDHQHTLSSMNNLAVVLQEHGKWQEAEKMRGDALEAWRNIVGEKHQGARVKATALLKKGNVPNPEIREKLSAGCTDNICFLTSGDRSEDLAELKIVKDSGFQEEVRAFLDDPEFVWKALAVVRMPAHQSSRNYGIFGYDSNILGIVVIKSSSDRCLMPLKVSAGIWLKKKDLRLIRRISSQIVLQVFGTVPMHRNHDVRRNRFTIEGVEEGTQIEAQITSSTKDGELQPEADSINLKVALGKDGLKSMQKAFSSYNLKLDGAERDFVAFADLVVKRLKLRPKLPKCFKLHQDATSMWLPGNLFKCTLSEFCSSHLDDAGFRTDLDGRIVVLLPSLDCDGRPLLSEDEEVFVAAVDTGKPRMILVPRITLHPLNCTSQEHLREYLQDKYKCHVKVRSRACQYCASEAAKISFSPTTFRFEIDMGEMKARHEKVEETWQDAYLCMDVVGGPNCMVQYANDRHGSMKFVEAGDLRLPLSLDSRPILADGEDAIAVEPIEHAI